MIWRDQGEISVGNHITQSVSEQSTDTMVAGSNQVGESYRDNVLEQDTQPSLYFAGREWSRKWFGWGITVSAPWYSE